MSNFSATFWRSPSNFREFKKILVTSYVDIPISCSLSSTKTSLPPCTLVPETWHMRPLRKRPRSTLWRLLWGPSTSISMTCTRMRSQRDEPVKVTSELLVLGGGIVRITSVVLRACAYIKNIHNTVMYIYIYSIQIVSMNDNNLTATNS